MYISTILLKNFISLIELFFTCVDFPALIVNYY